MNDLDQETVETLTERVISTIKARESGHCLQIPHLPIEVADATCQRVQKSLAKSDTACVVVEFRKHPWHEVPSKVVELRNDVQARGGRLVIFIPSGEQLAAEDSFGSSTFEVLETGDLYSGVVRRLREKLESRAPGLADAVTEILRVVKDSKFDANDRAVAGFLSKLVVDPTADNLGRSLGNLGLMPDTKIAASIEQIPVRLERNRKVMEMLVEPMPPAERVRTLPIDLDSVDGRRLGKSLLDALEDGTIRRNELAPRLKVDFADLPEAAVKIDLQELVIEELVGDISDEAERRVTKDPAAIGIRYRCRPVPNTVEGLKALTLELLRIGESIDDLVETGAVATKRGAQLKGQTWKLKVSDLDEGLYRFRLRAIDTGGLVLKEHMSETFKRGSEVAVQETVEVVGSIRAAEVRAVASGQRPGTVALSQTGDDDSYARAELIQLGLRFEGVRGIWRLEIPHVLARFERLLLQDPGFVGSVTVSARTGNEEMMHAEVSLPKAFLDARENLFAAVADHQLDVNGDTGFGPLVETADIGPLSSLIARYLESWTHALDVASDPELIEALLSVDQMHVTDIADTREIRIIAPTHPLRLAWLQRFEAEVGRWLNDSESGRELITFVDTAAMANVPHLVPGRYTALRYSEPLDQYWGVWLDPGQSDKATTISQIRAWLGLDRSGMAGIDIDDLLQRVKRYLTAHPYVDVLILNFVQPGAGKVVLDLLMRLQAEPETTRLRYVVRLFTSGLSRVSVGRALDDFMSDPEGAAGYNREAVDAFLSASENPLSPKLSYSKHEVGQLVDTPQAFPAHLTFFLDWFDLSVVPGPRLSQGRSFFVSNLIVEPAAAYSAGDSGDSPRWDEQVITLPEESDLFVRAYAIVERAVARLLPDSAEGQVPVVRLTLDRVQRSILDAVHRVSDWVVFVDPVFTDAYLDSPPVEGEVPRYLIDYVEPGFLETTRRIMVSTRSRHELAGLFQPILREYGLSVEPERLDTLVSALQLLGAGLPLKLLNNRTQALEALSLALGSVFLQAAGYVRKALAIPLDLHQDLVREAAKGKQPGEGDLKRTDLLVLQVDPTNRRFGANFFEFKARGALGGTISPDLIEQVGEQLANSLRAVSTQLFGSDLRKDSETLAAALQARRLYRLLTRYLDRAYRYDIVPTELRDSALRFIESVDEPYSVHYDKHAIFFDLEGPSKVYERILGIAVRRIGREEIDDLLARAQTQHPTAPIPSATEISAPTEHIELEALDSGVSITVPGIGEDRESTTPNGQDLTPTPGDNATDQQTDAGDSESDGGPDPASVLLVGGTPPSLQFGVIGRLAAGGQSVAFDLVDTSVVSLFGVQGSGKSYTVGTLLESALIQQPEVNRLPRPLGAVVFHYSTDMSYAPEVAAMARPNSDPRAIQILASDYGAHPEAVGEVVVIVPEGTLAERRAEYAGLEVEPLLLAPSELSLNDWQLLMGLKTADQMYAKAMAQTFRDLRGNVTIEALENAIESSDLTSQQKKFARQRITFVKEWISTTGGSVSRHVRPGRLTIVDLRDELIQEDDALSLFMVMLNRFAQVRTTDGRTFNKMIVFDEAHKYMNNQRLTDAIEKTIREMRHKGTTIVLASQDPPSLPTQIIALSSAVIAHKFTSPQWLDHLGRALGPFGNRSIKGSQLLSLKPGEAYLWAAGGSPALQQPRKIIVRPRLSQHGGATRRATD